MNRVRGALAVLIGILGGGVVVGLVEMINMILYPIPKDLDLQNAEAMKTYVSTLPTTALLIVVFAWIAGVFVGACAARLVAFRQNVGPSLLVTLFFTVMVVVNLLGVPSPIWMWIAGILGTLGGGLWGTTVLGQKVFSLQFQTKIEAEPRIVFETISNGDEFAKAIPDIVKVETIGKSPAQVGTEFRETRLMNGREGTVTFRVTEMEPQKLLRMEADMGGTHWNTWFTLQQCDSMCELTMFMEATPKAFAAKIVTPMMMGMMEKSLGKDLDHIKRYCEGLVSSNAE